MGPQPASEFDSGHTAELDVEHQARFGNVERVASERIGRETVTYVANIYKYYITYKLIADQQARREAAKASVRPRG